MNNTTQKVPVHHVCLAGCLVVDMADFQVINTSVNLTWCLAGVSWKSGMSTTTSEVGSMVVTGWVGAFLRAFDKILGDYVDRHLGNMLNMGIMGCFGQGVL